MTKATAAVTTATKATSALQATSIITKYPYQLLYLKAVHTYVNSSTERAKKVKYCKQQKFNGVIMYGIDGVISNTAYWTGLRAFIRELHYAGVKYVGLAYSSTNVIQFLNSFQDASTSRENFDFVVSEIEPWLTTSGVSWDSYLATIDAMKLWANSETDKVDSATYQGWCNKPTGTNADYNAEQTMRKTNKLYLHCYTYPEPRPSYLLSRMQIYGANAIKAGYSATTKMPVLTIFSAEQEFSQQGFLAKSPQQYYDDVVAYLDGKTFAGKEALDYKRGFVVFKDTDLMVSRPLV